MRWFIVFLLIANVAFFFWVQQESGKLEKAAALAPPDIGQLHLVDKDEPSLLEQRDDVARIVERSDPIAEPAFQPVEPVLAEPVQTALVLPKPDEIAPELESPVVGPVPGTASVPDADASQLQPVVEVETASVSEQLEETPKPAEAAKPEQTSMLEVADEAQEKLVAVELPSTAPLIEEVSDTATQTSAPPVDAPIETVVSLKQIAACYRVGPIKVEDADKLIADLPDVVELLSDTVEPTQTLIGYYVLIPPLGSIAAGNKKLEELKEAGITDTWLFRRGEYQFAISLGLFSRESSAKRHAANIGSKGFDVEIRQRTGLRDRRWLQLKDSDSGELGLVLPDGATATSESCP